MASVDIALAAGAALGECPLWSPDDQRLYWVDIDGKQVHRFDPANGIDEVRTVPGHPGSLVRTSEPGRFLMATETEAVWLDWETGDTTPWLMLEAAGTGNRLNDGRTDPAGRFWVGSMHEDTNQRLSTGMLHRIDGDGAVVTLRNDIGVSNGIAFDPDRGRMYFADTFRDTVWRYDYDLETGEPQNETVFVDFTDLPGRPDGACVDADGCYWVAAVYGWAVLRFTPDGVLDQTIEVPVKAPTMPAFGGTHLDTLFVTSIGGVAEPTRREPNPGALLAIDAGVTGRVDAPFAAPHPLSLA